MRTFKTQAYYVPDATIRLYSLQQYFHEQDAGVFWCDARHSVLTLSNGSISEFPYNPGSNLPLMLPDWRTPMGFMFNEATLFQAEAQAGFISVADKLNQNMTTSQKELLTWHWRLGHANFKWIQRLALMPRKSPDGMQGKPIVQTRVDWVSSCLVPLCAACQMSKQTQWSPEVKTGSPIPGKEMSLKHGQLQPGDMVSIDQYVLTMPGRLLNTFGK